jgi:putative nucleotidyltransferase with HDIG domain
MNCGHKVELVAVCPLCQHHHSELELCKNCIDILKRDAKIMKLKKGHRDEIGGIVRLLLFQVKESDEYTVIHSLQVEQIAVQIASVMAYADIDEIKLAAALHDIGKIAIPISLLNKPEKLTKEEMDIVKTHAVKGADMCQLVPSLRDIGEIIKYHHERFDGTGYPQGLRNNFIPEASRIISVADTISAMLTDRPHRKAKTKEEVYHELVTYAGTQFDPEIIELFVRKKVQL